MGEEIVGQKPRLEDSFPEIRWMKGEKTRRFLAYCWEESPRSVSLTDLAVNVWQRPGEEDQVHNCLRSDFLPKTRAFLAQECPGLTLYSVKSFNRWLLHPTVKNFDFIIPGEYRQIITQANPKWQDFAQRIHQFMVVENNLISILTRTELKLIDAYILANGAVLSHAEVLERVWQEEANIGIDSRPMLWETVKRTNDVLAEGRFGVKIESVVNKGYRLVKTA